MAFCYNPKMIIDAHTHVFSPRVINRRDDYIHRDQCFSMLYGNAKAKLATVQELLESMDNCGVDKAVIAGIGWTSHELCVENNDYILECLARYPNRLIGLATVQPLAGDMAVMELERCTLGGVKGVGEMRADVQRFDFVSGALDDLAAYLIAHNLVWLSHTSEPIGHTYDGKGSLTPEVVYPFVQRYPALKIILAHWGGGLPFYANMPEVRTALKNVYFDTAASPYLYNQTVYRQVVDIMGAEHILFGSDYPLISPARALAEVRTSGLPEQHQRMMMGENAECLFNSNTVAL